MRRIFSWLPVLIVLFGAAACAANAAADAPPDPRWSAARADVWYRGHRWITGENYIPAYAVNQLEMWQADVFDAAAIERELALAEGLGFNALRVFLHSAVWKEDAAGFKQRIDRFLAVADRHHLQTILVFFDDCWNKEPKPGPQPAPKPGVHNSGWMQDPGKPASLDKANYPELEKYVGDIVSRFAHDRRVLMWDVYNEPGVTDKGESSIDLLAQAFAWARAAKPEQPVTSGLHNWKLEDIHALQLAQSDVITYHNYEEPAQHLRVVQMLKALGRPVICTEYMARTRNSRFANILPMLKAEHVGAINWGLVAGKSNTIYAWDDVIADGTEPAEWFHDIFRANGEPYRRDEAELIRKLNAAK